MPTIPDKENLTLEEMLCEECHSEPPPPVIEGQNQGKEGEIIKL